jgi:hypothetical protein
MLGEAGRIFANALRQGELPASDSAYLTQLVLGVPIPIIILLAIFHH